MASTNSKITRVRPVFNWLHDNGGSNWPDRFLQLVTGFAFPIKAGKLLRMDLDPEREVSAGLARLAWMIRNLARLAPADGRLWRVLQEKTADEAQVRIALRRLDAGDTSGL